MPLAEYDRRRREVETRSRALERQEQELAGDVERQGDAAKLAAHADAFCRRVREGLAEADFARKRALLELLVDRVIVADGAVEIRYVIPTGPSGEREPFCRLRTDYLRLVPALARAGPVRRPAAGRGAPPAAQGREAAGADAGPRRPAGGEVHRRERPARLRRRQEGARAQAGRPGRRRGALARGRRRAGL